MRRIDHLAYSAALSTPTAEKATTLIRQLRDTHAGDEVAVERAFSDIVRAAWVRGEPWALEWTANATNGRTRA